VSTFLFKKQDLQDEKEMNRMRNSKGLIFLILYPVHLLDFILYIL